MQATLFGTDGIRTTMGQEPLTPQSLIQLGSALGAWLTQHKKQRLIIGHDTRLSCDLLKSALKTGLLQYPIKLVDARTLPTPALFYTVKHGPFDAGIMITASHNQYHDNGLKIFTKEQGKTTPTQEQDISNLYHTYQPVISYDHLGTESLAPTIATIYKQALYDFFPKDFLKNITIVLDFANGAFFTLAPEILKSFGAQIIALSHQPTGKNINLDCGSQYPKSVQQAVKEHQADIGFAFDGDGDRVTMVDNKGTIYNGDHILALLLDNPAYQTQTQLVSTIMANQALETHIKKQNKFLSRTAVGDKKVLKCMQEENCLVGGEPSGHIILRDFAETSDALFTTLRIIETLIIKKTWYIKTFTTYPQVLINMPIKLKKDLSLNPYAQIIDKHKKKLIDGRLVVRYSGTEPVLRVMIEDKTKEHAQTIGTLLSQELAKNLSKEIE
jgi:phosphoglucosamine mutase